MLDTQPCGCQPRVGPVIRHVPTPRACMHLPQRRRGAPGHSAQLQMVARGVLLLVALSVSAGRVSAAAVNGNATLPGASRRLATCTAGYYEDRRGDCQPCPEGTYLPGVWRARFDQPQILARA